MGDTTTNRRELLLGAGMAMLSSASYAAADQPGVGDPQASTGLTSAFDTMVSALNTGDIDRFWSYFDPAAIMIDEDAPWRFDLAGIKDHISFHGGGVWESFAWRPQAPRSSITGATGIIAGAATFRGKPKDAGFRLRHLLYVQGWRREKENWRLVLWHQSPLVGHVTHGSPG